MCLGVRTIQHEYLDLGTCTLSIQILDTRNIRVCMVSVQRWYVDGVVICSKRPLDILVDLYVVYVFIDVRTHNDSLMYIT